MSSKTGELRRSRLMNLFLLFKFFLPKIGLGHIVEFGSYKGGSAIFMAYLAQRFLGEVNVYGFDTFAGMPPTDHGIDLHRAGDFQDINLEELRQYVAQLGLTNLHFVQGRFEETVPATLETVGPLAVVHIDCDIYSAVDIAVYVHQRQWSDSLERCWHSLF